MTNGVVAGIGPGAAPWLELEPDLTLGKGGGGDVGAEAESSNEDFQGVGHGSNWVARDVARTREISATVGSENDAAAAVAIGDAEIVEGQKSWAYVQLLGKKGNSCPGIRKRVHATGIWFDVYLHARKESRVWFLHGLPVWCTLEDGKRRIQDQVRDPGWAVTRRKWTSSHRRLALLVNRCDSPLEPRTSSGRAQTIQTTTRASNKAREQETKHERSGGDGKDEKTSIGKAEI
ncbi:hypothetical protein FH972_025009 [Carpinus fangiana]|uniref:Uncharacterized protein n=1 Tax=Carpinus fangiana TaxID=176857 RepID=A0A5N6KZS7_9ROSI|nr:hypothetical protein FH972_025009 [Carpinus fangiana]